MKIETGAVSASFENGLNSMIGETRTEPVKGDNAKEVNANEHAEKSESKAPAWTSQLPEDIRGNAKLMEQLNGFAKIGDLATRFAELNGKQANSLIKPGKDASAEEVETFYQKLGKPTDVNGYSVQDKEAEALKEIAYKNNLTDDQMKGIYEGLKTMGVAVVQNQEKMKLQQVKSLEEAMKKQYGDKYGEKVAVMNRGIENFGGKKLGTLLNNAGVLFTPEVAGLFIQLGELSTEAGSSNIGTPGGNTQYRSILQGGTMSFKGL